VTDRIVGAAMDSYTLSLRWSDADAKPESLEFSGINAFTVPHIDPRTVGYMGSYRENQHDHGDEVHSHTEVSGLVTNGGDSATQSVKVAVVWYDREGNFFSYDSQVISQKLGAGANGRFVFMTHPKPMGFYSLVAEGSDYVAMLKEKGEMLIPVMAAPKSTTGAEEFTSEMSIRDVKLTDENSKPVPEPEAGQMLMLQSTVKNHLGVKQKFITIYQIKDANDVPVMLFWFSSQLQAMDTMDAAISWMPETAGTYTLQIYLWESMANPMPLGGFHESTITVAE
jgi:hypothetical protein